MTTNTTAVSHAPPEDAFKRRLEELRAELVIARDPVNEILSATVGTIRSPALPDVRAGLRAFAERAHDLSALDRELASRAAAEFLRELGVMDPRQLVRAALANGDGTSEKAVRQPAGSMLALKTPEPWPEPVDGAELLDQILGAVRRFAVVETAGAVACALWTVHAHAHDAAQVSPLLVLSSPAKRCGKTTLLTLVGYLVPRPLAASSITAPALFRAVEAFHPTLLVDEADTFLSLREELRGLLNAGHTRQFAVAVRTVGDEHEVRTFSTWAPKAIALIGRLPETLEDRSIVIPMRRRTRGEAVQPLRADRPDPLLGELCRKAARWAADHAADLRAGDPVVPPGLSDRAADNWRALFAIADLAGGRWPEDARQAAMALSGDLHAPDQGVEALLLADIRTLFDELAAERLRTSTILEHLTGMIERPWPEWSHGRPISARGLAKILGQFGIEPRKWREAGEGGVRGYERSQFEDAWTRYTAATPATPATSATSATAMSLCDLGVADVALVADSSGGAA